MSAALCSLCSQRSRSLIFSSTSVLSPTADSQKCVLTRLLNDSSLCCVQGPTRVRNNKGRRLLAEQQKLRTPLQRTRGGTDSSASIRNHSQPPLSWFYNRRCHGNSLIVMC